MTDHRYILLVDDDADDQIYFMDILQEITTTVKCHLAKNGLEAILHLKTISKLPYLIFLDLNMPHMNGFECLAIMKADKVFKNIPVIIFSTSNNPSDIEKTREMGANFFFNKPSDSIAFKLKLQEILEFEFKSDYVIF